MTCFECSGSGFATPNRLSERWIDPQEEIVYKKCPTCGGTGQSRDPYLVPGQVCEVWGFGSHRHVKQLVYFFGFDDEETLYFANESDDVGWPLPNCNYRPIGTEWDYSPTKKTHGWDAICSTVDALGKTVFWNTLEIYPDSRFISIIDHIWRPKNINGSFWGALACGICPDKSRYENGAWKTSLRERPFWAKGEK